MIEIRHVDITEIVFTFYQSKFTEESYFWEGLENNIDLSLKNIFQFVILIILISKL